MAFKINWKFLKSKKFIIIAAIVALVLIIVGISMSGGSKKSKYETAKVELGNLIQTVDVTGNIQAADDLSLNFQVPGVISYVAVKEGDSVQKGQLIANLSLADLDASVAAAQASLDQKLAGATVEQINTAQKQVDSAQTALTNAQTLATVSLNSKYDAALASLDDASVKMYNAFKALRDVQMKYFTGSTQESLNFQNNLDLVNNAQLKFKQSLTIIKISQNQSDIDSALEQAVDELNVIITALTANRDIIDKEPYKSTISETDKSLIETQKTTIGAERITISGIKNDILVAKSQNENAINTAEAALNLQRANYDSLVARPRDVDVAYYEAALAQAKANRSKAIMIAPISGEIGKVNKKKGELISSNEPMVELLSPHFEINVDVPETDVVKLKVQENATITFDAIGTDIKFVGTVMSIEPASTNIQDVIYYNVKVAINDDDNTNLLKSGMTADVLINTDSRQNVLYVPSRAVLSRANTGQKYVRVLENDKLVEKNVSVGLKADDGLVEILSGLKQGETIILKVL
ncbi:MAG: efflux RND transporter periplasmic adaptor subunit [Candidatus Paceibacterota bacterium]